MPDDALFAGDWRDIPVDATEMSVLSASLLLGGGLATIGKVAESSDEALLSISPLVRTRLADIREVIRECQSGGYVPPQWMVE